jgi:hypothetical protein
MPEPREPRSIIQAAQDAAAAGNHSTAEALLREAALLQEARLGPLHPDLANTLNNLGVVCEMTGNMVEADRSFRRAYAIATTVLKPDHPFVATSRKNLRDFCEARGTPIDLPSTRPSPPETTPPSPPNVRRRSLRPLAIGALGPVAMLIVVVVVSGPQLDRTERAESSPTVVAGTVSDIPATSAPPPAAPAPVEPIPVPDEVAPSTASHADEVSVSRITAASAPARPTVLKARLCADLDEWRCDPPDDPVPPGPLFFYTQVKFTRPTTVLHRWYRDDRLNQSVSLRVEANASGYRTYSRSTMNSDSAGNWRVELRTEDGALLHEERFSVR